MLRIFLGQVYNTVLGRLSKALATEFSPTESAVRGFLYDSLSGNVAKIRTKHRRLALKCSDVFSTIQMLNMGAILSSSTEKQPPPCSSNPERRRRGGIVNAPGQNCVENYLSYGATLFYISACAGKKIPWHLRFSTLAFMAQGVTARGGKPIARRAWAACSGVIW